MPQRNPAALRQTREREEDHQRKVADLRARLHEEARALRTPGDWARCLQIAARLLPGESFANILLISSQRPGATLVRRYREWHAMGRQVSRNEKGIEIFSVAREPAKRAHRDEEPEEHQPSWRDADRGYLRLGPIPAQRASHPGPRQHAGHW